MTYDQLIQILKARWLTIASWVGALLIIAIAINVILPNKYMATASVLINVNTPDPVEGYAAPMAMGTSYMSTQIDIINSEQVARRVVRMMRLDQSTALREQWQNATEGRGNFEAWAARALKGSLDVRPSKDSNLVNINFSSVDPNFSPLMANAFANVYIQTSIDLKTAPAKQYNSFFDARAKELKQQLEAAQTRLSGFQNERGMIASDERLDVETSRLNNLAATLVQAEGFSAESNSRQSAANKNSEQLQEVLGNPVIGALKTDLSRQEARLHEMGAKLGDAHPELAQLRANIAETRNRLAQETARVSGGARVNNVINKAREGEIATAFEAQRQKLLSLKQGRDTAAILIKDVEAAQRAYDAIQARLSQANLNSQINQTNVSLLTPAVEPDRPSSPTPVLNVAAAIVLGTLLGCGAAVFRERANPRIRTTSDITHDLQLNLLGLMPDASQSGKTSRWLPHKKEASGMEHRLLAPALKKHPALPSK